jgi:hypothetical protein
MGTVLGDMGTVLVVSTKNLSHGWMNQGTQPQKALVPEEIECRARPSYCKRVFPMKIRLLIRSQP